MRHVETQFQVPPRCPATHPAHGQVQSFLQPLCLRGWPLPPCLLRPGTPRSSPRRSGPSRLSIARSQALQRRTARADPGRGFRRRSQNHAPLGLGPAFIRSRAAPADAARDRNLPQTHPCHPCFRPPTLAGTAAPGSAQLPRSSPAGNRVRFRYPALRGNAPHPHGRSQNRADCSCRRDTRRRTGRRTSRRTRRGPPGRGCFHRPVQGHHLL